MKVAELISYFLKQNIPNFYADKGLRDTVFNPSWISLNFQVIPRNSRTVARNSAQRNSDCKSYLGLFHIVLKNFFGIKYSKIIILLFYDECLEKMC